MAEFRHYDLVEAYLSSRQRSLLRRALSELEERIENNPDEYMEDYGINSNKTIRTHLTEIENLRESFNLV